jgi:YfiH family protein
MERIIGERSAVSDQPSARGENYDLADQTLAKSGFYWREAGGVTLLVCRLLEDAGFANGFSTRLGGVSNLEGDGPGTELNLAGFNEDSRENIYENRRRFLTAFEGGYRLATAWQVHGAGIRVLRSPEDAGDADERADAVASNLENILAGVKTADCVPVLLGDPLTGAFAAVHAGWRGSAQGIVGEVVNAMRAEFGTSPASLIAAIGPAAGCENYEVGQDVMDAFAVRFPGSEKYFRETRSGHALVDLHAANRDQLAAAGVAPENIHVAPFCTMERVDLFFSYRIEKKKFGRTGRLMSVIGKMNRG